jgi:asparagine synthase (glutamine-hydrolysing)
MCGISGLFVSSTTNPSSNLQQLLENMNATMVHRGPDGDGFWISENQRIGLSHRRLAIVDLSTDATQPMSNLWFLTTNLQWRDL